MLQTNIREFEFRLVKSVDLVHREPSQATPIVRIRMPRELMATEVMEIAENFEKIIAILERETGIKKMPYSVLGNKR